MSATLATQRTLATQGILSPAQAPVTAERVFFVMMRDNGHWSPGARVVGVYATEAIAEMHARDQKKKHPHQVFGVATLCSEAHEVQDPIEIVRVG